MSLEKTAINAPVAQRRMLSTYVVPYASSLIEHVDPFPLSQEQVGKEVHMLSRSKLDVVAC